MVGHGRKGHRRAALAARAGAVALLLAAILTIGGAIAARAADDGAAIRAAINRQIAAFRRDDAEGAFAVASPNIRRQFGTAANFMAMVRGGYGAVYSPRSVTFGTLTHSGQEAVQEVFVVAADGTANAAIYLMQRQADGEWRINGVVLVPTRETGT